MDSSKASFSNANRHMSEEEELTLTSVGVDIGSSTSHLVFSRLQLTLEGTRYRVTRREVLNESEILLTPYVDETRIDVEALEAFINQQYKKAKIKRDEVDTGALILTGVAVRRRNARAIAELFAQEAGKFVAVSAGDGLEATMAAHGSGAVAHSAKIGGVVLNIDIGGGTSKFALCNHGKVQQVSAVDIGARLLAFDKDNAIVRIEEAGRKHAGLAGFTVELGEKIPQDRLKEMVAGMTDKLFAMLKPEAMTEDLKGLLRLPPLTYKGAIDCVMFSGGVSEFIYNREKTTFGDLGPLIAQEIHRRMADLDMLVMEPAARIRATVIGASQYTVQVSGNTVFISPEDAVPVRNIAVARRR
jgi:ethanolamine utilization protein EutA